MITSTSVVDTVRRYVDTEEELLVGTVHYRDFKEVTICFEEVVETMRQSDSASVVERVET